jgi:hypothetical protein
MPKFRADYDVKGSHVLPPDSKPIILRGDAPPFEMKFRNADPDKSGHAPYLIVEVIANSDSINDVANEFRSLLAAQLDILSFVTQSTFVIDQCRRVVEWEPFQKTREYRPVRRFDPLYPPSPDLRQFLFDAAQIILQANPPDYVLQALHYFRLGLFEPQPEDQFMHFWRAIETIAEGAKETTRIPIPCPKCSGELFCANCNEVPRRRPMSRQAIRELLERIFPTSPGLYATLVGTRDHLFHGRAPHLVETEIGRPLGTVVNDAGVTAWSVIQHSIPLLRTQIKVMQRSGPFANYMLTASPVMTFTYSTGAPHPTDDEMPKVEVNLITTFTDQA